MQENESKDYVTRVFTSPMELPAAEWNALLARQSRPTPFMRHEYLCALHESGSAVPDTGWTPRFVTLWRGDALVAACPLYLKDHSYGEYVFDWAWADAYQRHGLAYFPKAVIAVPFTPVPGTRLLASDAGARAALVQALLTWCRDHRLSSLHLLFGAPEDIAACTGAGLMPRHTVQFHWSAGACRDFDGFLGGLQQDKRKKIRQERRKVRDAGVRFRVLRGRDIGADDWAFFYRCYERTYHEHGQAPYLTREFFEHMAARLPEAWLLFVAEREGRPIATSLIATDAQITGTSAPHDPESRPATAWGRYWGALERVDCLHFEACYYQPIDWCIEHGVASFEGGAQGEHKMARALLPVRTDSAHWLAHPAFADAVQRFLEREGAGVEQYLDHLSNRTPMRRSGL